MMAIMILNKIVEKNRWIQWEIKQRDGKYKKAPNRSNRSEEYNNLSEKYIYFFNSKINRQKGSVSSKKGSGTQ